MHGVIEHFTALAIIVLSYDASKDWPAHQKRIVAFKYSHRSVPELVGMTLWRSLHPNCARLF